MKPVRLTLKVAAMESDKSFITARRYPSRAAVREKYIFPSRWVIKIYEVQQKKHGHIAGGKVTDSKRDLKYKFNDVQACDISLLSAGKFSREAENIYCLLVTKIIILQVKLKVVWVSMHGPSLSENSSKWNFTDVH